MVDGPNVGRSMREHRRFALQPANRDDGYNRHEHAAAPDDNYRKVFGDNAGRLAGAAYDVVGFFKTTPNSNAGRPDSDRTILVGDISRAKPQKSNVNKDQANGYSFAPTAKAR